MLDTERETEMSRIPATEVRVGDTMWAGKEQTIKKIENIGAGEAARIMFVFESATAGAWAFKPNAKVSVRNR